VSDMTDRPCGHDERDERDMIAIDIYVRACANAEMGATTIDIGGGIEIHATDARRLTRLEHLAKLAFDAADGFMSEWHKRHRARFGKKPVSAVKLKKDVS
jgi:hypothetical protein